MPTIATVFPYDSFDPKGGLPVVLRTGTTVTDEQKTQILSKATAANVGVVDYVGPTPPSPDPSTTTATMEDILTVQNTLGDLMQRYPRSRSVVGDGVLDITTDAPGGSKYVAAGAVSTPFLSVFNDPKRMLVNAVPGDGGDAGSGLIIADPSRAAISYKAWDAEFVLDDDYVGIGYYHADPYAETLRMWIDGQEVDTWYFLGTPYSMPSVASGPNALYYANLSFPDKRTRHIRFSGPIYLMFVVTNKNGKTYRPVPNPMSRFKAAIISDSWNELGAGTTDVAATHMRTLTGWDIRNCAVGGSGHLRLADTGKNFISRLPAVAAGGVPDLLVVNGSVNDLEYSEAQVIDAMGTFFDAVRTEFGSLPIFHAGLEDSPWFRSQYPAVNLEQREANLMDFAESDVNVVGTYRPAAENAITGTGNIVAPTGDGNADWKIGTDAVHMTALGHWDYATRLVNAMRPAPARFKEIV